MSTKAEAARAEEAKKGPNPKRSKKLAKRRSSEEKHLHHEPKSVAKKATYAKETTAPGKRPSRKSTRASQNRAKPDAALTRRADAAKAAPSERARTAKRKAKHPRGKKRAG